MVRHRIRAAEIVFVSTISAAIILIGVAVILLVWAHR